ncbi:hypothetical protein [Bosea sp. Root483D1]|uniref:hypothetical protein n=1 Tax=Bosea sp. Root483D1 TaxID=1736544 RepID=UPI000AD5B67D|nr:hypothetical protein [Bosea sp. Root483D1]
MRSQPKRSGPSYQVTERTPRRRELYREPCQDEEGNRYTVIVYRPFPKLAVTKYELEDGTPVRFIDDCLFEIESTRLTLTRCGL